MKFVLRSTVCILLCLILIIQSVFAVNLSKGDESDEVMRLQSMLNAIVSAGIKVGGYYGSLTKSSVEKYQELKGLPVTGVYDDQTRDALEADYKAIEVDLIWPLKGTNTYITSYYGGRIHPITGKAQDHSGIDISAPKGESVHAAAEGVLEIGCNTCTHNYGKNAEQLKKCGCGSGYGNHVIITYPDGKRTLYAHLTSILVEDGATVSQDQQIGTVGSTGRSTGYHLHFEVHLAGTYESRVDPLEYVDVPSFITIGEGNYLPQAVERGSGYFLSGKISSIYSIVSVTVSIYTLDGQSTGQKKTAKPYSRSYDISDIDPYIHFGKLKAGNYILKIEASDGSGAESELVSHPFAITSKINNSLLESFTKIKTYKDGIFTDVGTNDWYSNNIELVYETGLMEGVGSKLFNPKGNVTIAEAITVASRIYSYYHGVDINTKGASIWYKPYVDFASEQGIYTAADADLNKPATRAQLAYMLARAVSSADLQQKNTIADDAIPDIKISDEYAREIYLLYRAGVLTGSDSKGSFLPDTFVARSEAAAMITRIIAPELRMEATIK
ncbi:MAG: peptidoglycan DD-metalloendopeptidase family protein [Clostridia bacterium]|nr:peptidoglycan DD-metalloendopeptidase family protein [Clostridia bacterium]